MATRKAARMATSVLPKPTSPHTSRSMGRGASRSLHVVDRAGLIRGLVEGEGGLEGAVVVVDRRQGLARAGARRSA
jgi:hypothetical protein